MKRTGLKVGMVVGYRNTSYGPPSLVTVAGFDGKFAKWSGGTWNSRRVEMDTGIRIVLSNGTEKVLPAARDLISLVDAEAEIAKHAEKKAANDWRLIQRGELDRLASQVGFNAGSIRLNAGRSGEGFQLEGTYEQLRALLTGATALVGSTPEGETPA